MTGIKAVTLEQRCRARGQAFVRFDYFGHGASSGRFEDGTIGRWADDAVTVIDQLSQGPQLLVGSSMGGWIMLLAALLRPERIAGLIGIASAPDFTEDLIWGRLDDQTRVRFKRDGVWRRPSQYSADPYPISYRLIEEARQHRLLHDTIALRCPLRLMHGLRDADVPWQTSQRLLERYVGEDARLTLFKDGEHRLSRTQDLALLDQLINELL